MLSNRLSFDINLSRPEEIVQELKSILRSWDHLRLKAFLKLLSRHKIDLNSPDYQPLAQGLPIRYETWLIYALKPHRHLPSVSTLLEHGNFDLEARGSNGRTFLHEYLLDGNLSVNFIDSYLSKVKGPIPEYCFNFLENTRYFKDRAQNAFAVLKAHNARFDCTGYANKPIASNSESAAAASARPLSNLDALSSTQHSQKSYPAVASTKNSDFDQVAEQSGKRGFLHSSDSPLSAYDDLFSSLNWFDSDEDNSPQPAAVQQTVAGAKPVEIIDLTQDEDESPAQLATSSSSGRNTNRKNSEMSDFEDELLNSLILEYPQPTSTNRSSSSSNQFNRSGLDSQLYTQPASMYPQAYSSSAPMYRNSPINQRFSSSYLPPVYHQASTTIWTEHTYKQHGHTYSQPNPAYVQVPRVHSQPTQAYPKPAPTYPTMFAEPAPPRYQEQDYPKPAPAYPKPAPTYPTMFAEPAAPPRYLEQDYPQPQSAYPKPAPTYPTMFAEPAPPRYLEQDYPKPAPAYPKPATTYPTMFAEPPAPAYPDQHTVILPLPDHELKQPKRKRVRRTQANTTIFDESEISQPATASASHSEVKTTSVAAALIDARFSDADLLLNLKSSSSVSTKTQSVFTDLGVTTASSSMAKCSSSSSSIQTQEGQQPEFQTILPYASKAAEPSRIGPNMLWQFAPDDRDFEVELNPGVTSLERQQKIMSQLVEHCLIDMKQSELEDIVFKMRDCLIELKTPSSRDVIQLFMYAYTMLEEKHYNRQEDDVITANTVAYVLQDLSSFIDEFKIRTIMSNSGHEGMRIKIKSLIGELQSKDKPKLAPLNSAHIAKQNKKACVAKAKLEKSDKSRLAQAPQQQSSAAAVSDFPAVSRSGRVIKPVDVLAPSMSAASKSYTVKTKGVVTQTVSDDISDIYVKLLPYTKERIEAFALKSSELPSLQEVQLNRMIKPGERYKPTN